MSVTNHHEPLDPIESLLAELDEAERAGLFGRTPLPRRAAWTAEPATTPFPFRTMRRLAIAAVIVLAAGVWTMMFRSNITTLQNRSRLTGTVQVADNGMVEASLARCIAGPNGSVDPTCERVDFDGDGDVDLADFRSFQVSFAVRR